VTTTRLPRKPFRAEERIRKAESSMMDRPLTEVVRGTFAPYVLVVATQEAHDACLRRGTTPVALFRDSLVPSRGK